MACRPAPQISVWAFSTVPDFSRTRVGSMLSTTSPSMISTVRFSSAFAAYVCNFFLNIDRTASPASTTMIRA